MLLLALEVMRKEHEAHDIVYKVAKQAMATDDNFAGMPAADGRGCAYLSAEAIRGLTDSPAYIDLCAKTADQQAEFSQRVARNFPWLCRQRRGKAKALPPTPIRYPREPCNAVAPKFLGSVQRLVGAQQQGRGAVLA